MIKSPKMVGINFLHKHATMEKQLNVDSEHIIVDRHDWEEIVRFFNENRDCSARLNKNIEKSIFIN